MVSVTSLPSVLVLIDFPRDFFRRLFLLPGDPTFTDSAMSSVSSKLYCADRRWWTEGGLLTVALSGFLSVGACILPVLWSCCQQKLCHLFMHINTCNIKHLVVLVILTKNIQGDYTYQEFSLFHWLAIKNNLWKIKSTKINNCVQLQVSLWLMKNILYQNKPHFKKSFIFFSDVHFCCINKITS